MAIEMNRMPKRNAMREVIALAAFASALSGCSVGNEPAAPDEAFIAKAEALTMRFQSELQGALSTAMAESGPVGAIGVCQSTAPAIAQNLSQESGLSVSRVARRNRNEGNAIGNGLEPLYAELEKMPSEDGAPTAVHRRFGDRQVYLRAIPMQEQPCAACHGNNIAPEVRAAIDQLYPEDLATGFEAGELRGAFLVETSGSAEE